MMKDRRAMISRVFIDNYKCFCNSEILLPAGNILVSGANGVGKTTFFDVLEVLRNVICRGADVNSDVHLLGDTYTRWKPKGGVQSQRFELSLKGNGGEYAYELVVDNGGKQGMSRISTERLLYDNKPIFAYGDSNVHLFDNDTYIEKVSFGSDWSKSFISSVVDRHENSKLIWFRNWMDKSIVLNPNPWHIQSAASTESRFLDRTMSNFAQWFRYLKQVSPDSKYSELLQDLKFALHGFQGLRFVDIGDSAKELKIQMSEGEYSLKELSEGQRLIIALYTAFHFAMLEGGVFCIDEPDNFLGLGEIEPLVATLLDDDDSYGQRIVSSHHPEFYNRVQHGHGLYFCRKQEIDDSATRVKPFESVFGGHSGIDVSEVVARGWED